MMDKSYVTLEQAVCPICGKAEDTGNLLLDKRLRERFEMHTPTGYGLCAEHKAMVDAGYVVLVECDPTKSQPKGDRCHPADAYRTGNMMQVRKEAFTRLFNIPIPPGGFAFIDDQAFAAIKRLADQANEATP